MSKHILKEKTKLRVFFKIDHPLNVTLHILSIIGENVLIKRRKEGKWVFTVEDREFLQKLILNDIAKPMRR